uniref:C2H2-type domain-containing protein n=1 Tax=Timema douglasi TaxID=61478 RepID=A0A7R8VY58_TIMDO|nr:unnamed protein product [Timema douglasi]
MKCECNEEDNERSEPLPLAIEVSTLSSSLPFIKEEIKNELDCHATQVKLESTIESVLHSFIKPEKTSNAPASGVCEELRFKEELCFDESSIDVSENKSIREHRPHKCDECGKCFKEKRKLKIHLTSHGEHRPQKCVICGKRFKLNTSLKSHLITHILITHGEHRPHKCDVCGKCFILNSYLKSHLASHSEHRLHKCDICGKCFKKNFNLKRHLGVHGVEIEVRTAGAAEYLGVNFLERCIWRCLVEKSDDGKRHTDPQGHSAVQLPPLRQYAQCT